MAFCFFVGSILFMMQLHTRSCCNYKRILVFYSYYLLFLMQLHTHGFPRSIGKKALMLSTKGPYLQISVETIVLNRHPYGGPKNTACMRRKSDRKMN